MRVKKKMSHRRAFRPSYGTRTGLKYRTVGKKGSYRRTATKRYQRPTMLVPMRYQGLSLMQDRESIERKSIDTAFVDNAVLIPATNAFSIATLLNGVAQGTDVFQRVGRKCLFKSLQYRIEFTAANGATPATQPLRVLVVYDRQPNGALATNADVLAAQTFVGNNNLGNADRFVTISDVVHGEDSQTPVTGKVHRKMALETIYGLTTGVIGAISSGAILVFFAQAGSANITFNAQFRLRYTDA